MKPHQATSAQQAFAGLLTRPLLTPAADPELHRAVVRHYKTVTESARRLGYRIVTVGATIRLLRIPVGGHIIAPPPPPDAPTRRVLALTCALAAACEDSTGATTLAKLSGLVQHITAATDGIGDYDQSLLTHRRALLKAARLLEGWGLLVRRTDDDRLLEGWAEGGAGIGAGYEIDREALLLLTSPDVLALAFSPADDPELSAGTHTLRMLRALVETPALLYADLSAADADLLKTTRGLRAGDTVNLLGGHVEARSEGMVHIADDEPRSPLTMDFPKAATSSWVALLALDMAAGAGQRHDDGTVHLDRDDVDAVIADLHTWRGAYLTKAMKEEPAVVRREAETELLALSLLTVTPTGGWVISPVAGRYRDPDIVLPDAQMPQESPPAAEHPSRSERTPSPRD